MDDIFQSPIAHNIDENPSFEEVEKCVHSLKNNKSPGIDGVPAEIFKYEGGSVIRDMHKLIEAIWEYELLQADRK